MKCPKCSTTVLTQNINFQAGIAKCTHCKTIFKVSENLSDGTYETFDINTPPSGVSFRRDADITIISATTRSGSAIFFAFFTFLFSYPVFEGIVDPKSFEREHSATHSYIDLLLFILMCIIVSVYFCRATLMAIFGKLALTLDRQGGKIFIGIGKIGFTQRFMWNEISSIDEQIVYTGASDNLITKEIAIKGKKAITFGSGLSDDRRYYILHALKKIYRQVKR